MPTPTAHMQTKAIRFPESSNEYNAFGCPSLEYQQRRVLQVGIISPAQAPADTWLLTVHHSLTDAYLSKSGPGRMVTVSNFTEFEFKTSHSNAGDGGNWKHQTTQSISIMVFRRGYRDYPFAYDVGGIPSLSTTA